MVLDLDMAESSAVEEPRCVPPPGVPNASLEQPMDEDTDVLDEAAEGCMEEPRDMAHMKELGDAEKALIPMLATVLEALVERNDAAEALVGGAMHQPVTPFHALKAPAVQISDYIERIRRYSACSPCCFVVGLVYMDRYLQRNPSFVLTSLSVHRLLLTCVLLSAKFLDDFYYNNAFWSKVGGVPLPELNSLELELLFKLNFDLHVRSEEYLRYRKTLIQNSQAVIVKPTHDVVNDVVSVAMRHDMHCPPVPSHCSVPVEAMAMVQ